MAHQCESCGEEISELDIKCPECGHLQSSSGIQHMLGTVVLGQYEIVDVLGQGGMSVVYKGRHNLTEQEVALKILPPEMALLNQVKSRFLEEARALAQLDHPNIVHLYNFGEDKGCFVLAMQYVQGHTFERMIIDAEALEWTIAARIAIDVLRALEYAHGRGIIHRDMKPSNVLVREDDGSATVMDFGIAKMTNSTRLTATGQTMGTVRYMSPEQVRGLAVDPRTDIYSLGATLYEAIHGDTPFDGDTHFEIMSKHLTDLPVSLRDQGVDVPITLDAVILKSLAKKPDDRFKDARQFRKELEAVLREHDIGWAETMRLTRGGLQPLTSSKDAASDERASTAPATPNALDAAVDAASESRRARRATPPKTLATPAEGPASSDKATAALDMVSSDEIALGHSATDNVRAPTARPATEPPTRPTGGRGSFVWVALVGVLLLAGGSATFYILQTRGAEKRGSAASTETPDTRDLSAVPDRLLEPFRPPDYNFALERIFTRERIRVMAAADWDPEAVLASHREGHRIFAELLKRNGLADEIPLQPLSIAIVPKHVFCYGPVYEQGKAPADCKDRDIYYRPMERTLLVADDREYFDVNLAYGNATAVCLHTGDAIPRCLDTVIEIDAEFDKRR